MIADRDGSFESKHMADGSEKSSDNEACQKSTTYRKIVLYVLMAASKKLCGRKAAVWIF